MTRSAKQKKQLLVLVILTVFLAAVMYWQYLIAPVLTECGDLESEIEDYELRQLDIVSDILGITVLEEENAGILDKLSAETEKLFPVIPTDNADILILGYLNKSGLSARILLISAGEPGSAAEDDSEESKDTGIRIISASYEAQGSYSSLWKFIAMINSEPAIYINGISAAAQHDNISAPSNEVPAVSQAEIANENDLILSIDVSLYMYEAPSIPEHFEEQDEVVTSESEEQGTR